MDRRRFINSCLASVVSVGASQLYAQPAKEKILLLIELKGGNDGLNTLIPYEDDTYYELRPTLAVKKDKVLKLSDGLGLNPAMEALMPAWQKGELAMVLGLGYAHPNRSHFRSADIWHSGSDGKEVLVDGWLSSYLQQLTDAASHIPAEAFILDGRPFPCQGKNNRVVTLGRPKRFVKQAERMMIQDVVGHPDNPAFSHLLRVRDNIRSAARIMKQDLYDPQNIRADFHCGTFGEQVTRASQLIISGMGVPIIKVALHGFDTHASQYGTQQRLLTELATGITDFRVRLQKAGLWNRVIIMTYSEFGRRVAENGSKGTDHGTANVQMVIGSSVKGGLYGQQPSLIDLDDGDLKYNMDYRRLYATILEDWFGLSSGKLPGGPYKSLGFIG